MALLAGSRPHPLPPPLGPADNGLLVDAEDGQLFIRDEEGFGHPITSAAGEVVDDPAWSPDGTHIAFYSWPVRSAAAFPGTATGIGPWPPLYDSATKPIGSLVVVDPDGGHRVVLARSLTLDTGVSVYPPAWSHDSRSIAFSDTLGQVSTIKVVSVAGSIAIASGSDMTDRQRVAP